MTRTRYWWDTAPIEARKVQVTHAAEAGLTCGETAVLLGTYPQAIVCHARTHGISFANSDKTLSRRRQVKNSDGAAAARVASWRAQGMENVDIFDRIDARRDHDDGLEHELRFEA